MIDGEKIIEVIQGVTYVNTPFHTMRLSYGDRVYISRDIYKIKLNEYIHNTGLKCVQLHKRNKWWQFWKPRYKGASYIMLPPTRKE